MVFYYCAAAAALAAVAAVASVKGEEKHQSIQKKHQIEPLFKTITVQNYRPEEKTGSFFVD